MAKPTTNYASSIIDDVDAQMPGALPDGLLRLYALLALIKGRATTLADVHDAWAIWRQVTDQNHRSLIPFAELSSDVQELDRPYMDAIHRAAPAAELTDAQRCWSCDHPADDHDDDGCTRLIRCSLVTVEQADEPTFCPCASSAESARTPERDAEQAGDDQ